MDLFITIVSIIILIVGLLAAYIVANKQKSGCGCIVAIAILVITGAVLWYITYVFIPSLP